MASTVTLTTNYNLGSVRKLVYTAIAHTDGVYTTATLPAFTGRLVELHTNPGGTAPQDNYDITLVDQNGVDRLYGVGLNRHTSNSQAVAIIHASTSLNPIVHSSDALVLTIANNNVNGAIAVIEIFYEPIGWS